MTASDGTGEEPERRVVGIGEYAVSTDGAVLATSGLGSCVGLALLDRDAGVAGLAHPMLPSATEASTGHAAKFADTGADLLVEEMVARGADPASMEAKLAGGSDMLDVPAAGVGARNASAIRETLAARDIPVVAEDVGGEQSRSLRLEPATGDLVVERAAGDSIRL